MFFSFPSASAPVQVLLDVVLMCDAKAVKPGAFVWSSPDGWAFKDHVSLLRRDCVPLRCRVQLEGIGTRGQAAPDPAMSAGHIVRTSGPCLFWQVSVLNVVVEQSAFWEVHFCEKPSRDSSSKLF